MKVTFRNLKLVVATSFCDNANLAIACMEADDVNQIIIEPDMVEEGLHISKREKHVKSRMIYLFGYDKDHIPVIIEVKRSLTSISAVQQLRMYVNDMRKMLRRRICAWYFVCPSCS